MAWEWEEKPPKHSRQQADAQADKSDALESPSNGYDVGWANSPIPQRGLQSYREREVKSKPDLETKKILSEKE